jgi:biopolymer transport protein TolQ
MAAQPQAGRRADRRGAGAHRPGHECGHRRESEFLNKGLGFLATTGSTAPFIGLFGTVWGIKHSFEQIAISQNTNLAVVAPGIAEALLATGVGLIAAIPAVVAITS